MLNTYLFKGNEILIDAPGNANENRIKNDLIWDINNLLTTQFNLYMFFVCKKPSDSVFCIPVSGFPKKYVAFQKLDYMFIQRTVLSDNEINCYREIMDPLRKMNDDVFRETCCVENVDIEYVATENIDWLLSIDITGKSMTSLNRWIVSLFPIYISLFGSKEMRIVINQSSLLEPIKGIVVRHCVKKHRP